METGSDFRSYAIEEIVYCRLCRPRRRQCAPVRSIAERNRTRQKRKCFSRWGPSLGNRQERREEMADLLIALSLNRHRNLGTKFQTPISKQIPITNLQNRNKRLTLGYWDLELPWDLELEIWDFLKCQGGD